jgi:hypothetical protein
MVRIICTFVKQHDLFIVSILRLCLASTQCVQISGVDKYRIFKRFSQMVVSDHTYYWWIKKEISPY